MSDRKDRAESLRKAAALRPRVADDGGAVGGQGPRAGRVVARRDLSEGRSIEQIHECKARELELVDERLGPRRAEEHLVHRRRLLLVGGIPAHVPEGVADERWHRRIAPEVEPVPPVLFRKTRLMEMVLE